MKTIKNIKLPGAGGRHFLLDLYAPHKAGSLPVVVFVHGFKGFKDWGHWHLIARWFVDAGFLFVTFNFSHNGTSVESPLDFVDLEAYGHNNYSKEIYDLDVLLNWLENGLSGQTGIRPDTNNIFLIGHSRGGGIGFIKAAEDQRIQGMISWAAVSQLDFMWKDNQALLLQWSEEGKIEILNGRTQQMMPVYIQLVEDFNKQADRYNIEKCLQNFGKPLLIVHGSEDPAVPVEAAQQLHAWHHKSELHIIEGADHVFGGKHPFEDGEIPPHSRELVKKSIEFLTRIKS